MLKLILIFPIRSMIQGLGWHAFTIHFA